MGHQNLRATAKHLEATLAELETAQGLYIDESQQFAIRHAKLTHQITAAAEALSTASSPAERDRMIDSLSEMGERESRRLQKVMYRLDKLMAAQSNLMKDLEETSQAITHNIA
jgi:hypothetical protein